MSATFFWSGDYLAAANVALEWASQIPSDGEAYSRAVEAYLRAGEAYYWALADTEAQLVFEKALQLAPKNAKVEGWLGLIALRRGDTELARQHFELAIARDPRYAETLFEMANRLMVPGESLQAIAVAEQAVSLHTGECPAAWHAQLGAWYETIGKVEQAINAYEAALQCNPDLMDAQQALNKILSTQREDN